MKLKNKKTGEIVEVESLYLTQTQGLCLNYMNKENKQKVYTTDKIASFNLDWEDYEEPKEYRYIDYDGEILCGEFDNSSTEKMMISMGNHFESTEEAKKAVEKLKAWKRLKDKGIEFTNWEFISVLDGKLVIEAKLNFDNASSVQRDLEICFGGEE